MRISKTGASILVSLTFAVVGQAAMAMPDMGKLKDKAVAERVAREGRNPAAATGSKAAGTGATSTATSQQGSSVGNDRKLRNSQR